MGELLIGDARLFLRTFGERRDAELPVVLIHGATADGETDWGEMARRLGRSHFVVLPDCRGHGRSLSPHDRYSFAGMAADTAGLIRGLGFERVHLVGHSNGGNVALVTLLEHPDVVETCVIQAGNAYVSPDLVADEPAKFDPDRVDREEPAWRDRMIRIHGPWHGEDYWRTLLRLTVAEIVSAPAYTSVDLARVDRRTLVIEGRQDTVNARSGHGEFIARHIPGAELWRPAASHSVHKELPQEWQDRVETFWAGPRKRGASAIS